MQYFYTMLLLYLGGGGKYNIIASPEHSRSLAYLRIQVLS